MNRSTPLALVASLVLLLAACSNTATDQSTDALPFDDELASEVDRLLVVEIQDRQRASAVVTARSVSVHQFRPNSSVLTSVGRQNVQSLAPLFDERPCNIVVRRGDASDELYAARVETIRLALIEVGVPTDRILLADGVTSGDGISSNRARLILQRESEASAGSGSSGGSGDSGMSLSDPTT